MNAVPSTTTLLLAILAALALGGVIWFVVLRRRDLEQRVEEFQALSDAVQAIASATLDETALCALVHEQAARLMDARTFQLGFFDGADYDLRVRVVRGQSAKVGRFEIGHPGGIIGWMRDTGKPLLVRDFRRELDALPALPRSLDGDAEGLPRSGVFVPMLAGDAVIGALAIQSDQPNAYTDRHLRVLSIIANLAAAAVQNARALARERKRATQLGLIDTVAYRTASLLDLDTLLTTLVEAIQGAYGYAYVGLYLSDRVTGEVECRAATHPLEVGLRRPPGAGLIGTAITDGKTLRVNDVSADARFLATPNLRDTRSEAVVPLYLENKVIGALDLQSGQTNAFLSEDQAYLEALAQVVAVAVGNAQLYEAEREQAWQSAAMLQVADAARSAQSFEEASESVATVTQLLGGVEACGLLLRNADGRYRIAAVRGQLSDHERLTPGDVILTEDIPALALMEASRAPAWSDEPGRLRGPARALPLIAHDDVIAAMVTLERPANADVRARREALLGALANQAALALDAVRANIAEDEEAWATAALLEVASAVNGEYALDDIAARVARLTLLLVGVDGCALFARDAVGDGLRLVGAAGIPRDTRGALAALDPMLWADWSPADEGAEPAAAPELIAALLPFAVTRALPLLARGRPVGALLIGVRRADRQPGERARTVLSGIAQQVAMAIDNAQLIREALVAQRLENELALARDIQQSFLPREAPQLEGWTIAVDWQSARQVGGDFYDFIHMQEDGRLGIAIADVADKGVPAALFMAMTRSLLRGAAFSGREPDAVLKRVNRLVLADTRSDLFVTVFYAILDAASGLMHYANAGHNPPLRLSATGELAPLAGNGMAIGVFEQVEIPLCTVKLDPGDVLLMYTDGLIDAVSESGEEFGLARLGEVLVACGARPASDIAAAAMDAIRAHTGGEQPFDDQTLVVIRRDPAGSANR